jgi:hypothetical protein
LNVTGEDYTVVGNQAYLKTALFVFSLLHSHSSFPHASFYPEPRPE